MYRYRCSSYEIQSNNVIVAFCGIELDRKTAGIASLIWEFSAKGNSREANEDWGLLARRLQETGFATWSKVSWCSCAVLRDLR